MAAASCRLLSRVVHGRGASKRWGWSWGGGVPLAHVVIMVAEHRLERARNRSRMRNRCPQLLAEPASVLMGDFKPKAALLEFSTPLTAISRPPSFHKANVHTRQHVEGACHSNCVVQVAGVQTLLLLPLHKVFHVTTGLLIGSRKLIVVKNDEWLVTLRNSQNIGGLIGRNCARVDLEPRLQALQHDVAAFEIYSHTTSDVDAFGNLSFRGLSGQCLEADGGLRSIEDDGRVCIDNHVIGVKGLDRGGEVGELRAALDLDLQLEGRIGHSCHWGGEVVHGGAAKGSDSGSFVVAAALKAAALAVGAAHCAGDGAAGLQMDAAEVVPWTRELGAIELGGNAGQPHGLCLVG
eukprot:m.299975 g.299975  ORF g.299975 m.299975 type:complete len:350 (+) comp14309_c0_seq1:110-1159(+)